jgi:hypothetical protein
MTDRSRQTRRSLPFVLVAFLAIPVVVLVYRAMLRGLNPPDRLYEGPWARPRYAGHASSDSYETPLPPVPTTEGQTTGIPTYDIGPNVPAETRGVVERASEVMSNIDPNEDRTRTSPPGD